MGARQSNSTQTADSSDGTQFRVDANEHRAALWPTAPSTTWRRSRPPTSVAQVVVPEDTPLSLTAPASPNSVTLGLPEHIPDSSWDHEVVAFQFIPEHLPGSNRRSLPNVGECNRMKECRARALSAWSEESSTSLRFSRSDSIQSRAIEDCGCGQVPSSVCRTCDPSRNTQPALTLRVKGIKAKVPTPLPGVVVNTGGISCSP